MGDRGNASRYTAAHRPVWYAGGIERVHRLLPMAESGGLIVNQAVVIATFLWTGSMLAATAGLSRGWTRQPGRVWLVTVICFGAFTAFWLAQDHPWLLSVVVVLDLLGTWVEVRWVQLQRTERRIWRDSSATPIPRRGRAAGSHWERILRAVKDVF